MTVEQNQKYITALLRERHMAEQRGDADNVRAVNDELNRLGVEAAPPAKRAARRPRKKPEER